MTSRKFWGGVAVMFLASVTTARAQAISVTGNGANSTNTVVVEHMCQDVVEQKNVTHAASSVSSTAATGENKADANTGGTVSVDTGNADSKVTVTVSGGDNNAIVSGCCNCCCATDVQVTVENNGEKSVNAVMVSGSSAQVVRQRTRTTSYTTVLSKAKTGKNTASKNTGSGVEVKTGSAKSTVSVSVSAGSNSAVSY